MALPIAPRKRSVAMPVVVFIFKARGVAPDTKHPTRTAYCPEHLATAVVQTLDGMDVETYGPALKWLDERFWSGKREENPDLETACGFDDRLVVLAVVNLAQRLGDTAALEYAQERLCHLIAQTPPDGLGEWRPLLGFPQDGGYGTAQEQVALEMEHRFVHLGESPSARADSGAKWGLYEKVSYEAFAARVKAAQEAAAREEEEEEEEEEGEEGEEGEEEGETQNEYHQ